MENPTCSMMMIILVSILLAKGYAQQPGLSVTVKSSGEAKKSPADILYGTAVKLKCTFPQISGITFNTRVRLRTKSDDETIWTVEAQCIYSNANVNSPITNIGITNTLDIKESDILCSPSRNYAEFSFEPPLSDKVNYDCIYEDLEGTEPGLKSDDVVLNTYSKPNTPIITMDPTSPVEGKQVVVICTSSARPAPALVIKLGGVTQAASTNEGVISPSDDTVQQSSVVWNTTADSSMHSKELTCETNTAQHPYKGEVSKTNQLVIIYGPDAEQTAAPEIDFNIKTQTSVKLVCSIDGYPMSYEWMQEAISVSMDAELTLTSDNYKDISTIPSTRTFKCVGTNTNTQTKASKDYTVRFTKPTDVPPTGNGGNAGGNTESENKLEPKEIAGIVIGVIVIVLIIVIIIVCAVKRKKGSSNHAEKAKAAQARRSSDEKTEEPRFQSSTASFGMPNSAIDRNTYSENATLQMENRYGNMGQYADVIDDRPRSRKPIAPFDEMMLDDNVGPPNYDGPPAYVDSNPYRSEPSYSAYSPGYGSSYGAAC